MFKLNIILEDLKRCLGIRSPSGIAARDCGSCRKQYTDECPIRSANCYATIDKPHFEAW